MYSAGYYRLFSQHSHCIRKQSTDGFPNKTNSTFERVGWMVLQAFDYDTGRPKRYVEMLSWPRAHRLHRALPTVLAGVFWESFVPTKAAATMRIMFNRYFILTAAVN